MDSPLLWIGTLTCAAFAAVALLPLARPARVVALTTALLIAPVLILGDNWDSSRISDLRDRPSLVAAGLLAGAVGLIVLALIFRKRPLLLAPALIATMPFRIPIDLGSGEELKILLPLYAVIAGGVLAALVGVWVDAGENGAPPDRPPNRRRAERGWLRWIGPALAAIVVLYALQAGYADDLTPALQNVAFFLAPFAALYYMVEHTKWDAAALRTIVWVLAVEGLIFVAVGIYQYVSGDLFWNDKVIAGNEAHTYFRVNSLFFDPNILGRYLVVAMAVLAAVVAYGRRSRDIYACGALYVVLLVLLVFSFSQTSSIALFAALCVLIAARWGLFAGVGAGAATLVALALSILARRRGWVEQRDHERPGRPDRRRPRDRPGQPADRRRLGRVRARSSRPGTTRARASRPRATPSRSPSRRSRASSGSRRISGSSSSRSAGC